MGNLIANSNIAVIIGTGITGRSAARFFVASGRPFVWLDTREQPPALDAIREEFPQVNLELGALNPDTLLSAEQIVVSPGVALSHPAIAKAIDAGIDVLGDVDLFLREAKAPVVAITGSNAKSTVTALVGEMAADAGLRVAVGGNIGVPVLDLLTAEEAPELYVLELSSFQLETVKQLNAEVATILNISEDHMDRYDSLAQYHLAKQRIYFGARKVVVNREDPLTVPPLAGGVEQYSFGLNRADRAGFGLTQVDGVEQLTFEFKPLMPAANIKLPGRHNVANALAALALGHAVNLPMASMLQTLQRFEGLPHRCQWVAECDGVTWYNDSKGTNVGATLAALQGLKKDDGRIVLIAGGVGKGADFSPLQSEAGELRAAVLMGEDADKIGDLLKTHTQVIFVKSMNEAVAQAEKLAQPGDDVLLSPACASFDMFKGFEDRGNAFVTAVKEVLQ